MLFVILIVAMFVYAIVVMVKGELALSQQKVVYGVPARILAILLMLPFPLMVVVLLGFGVYIAVSNPGIAPEQIERNYWGTTIAIQLACTVVPIVLMYLIGLRYARDPREVYESRRALDKFDDDDDWKRRSPDDGRGRAPQTPSDAIVERPPERPGS